jgi:transketolase C-terminal domain/subunit
MDSEALDQAFRSAAVFTVDEHTLCGGFSAMVAAYARQSGYDKKLVRSYAIPDCFAASVGGRDYQLKKYQLDSEALATDMLSRLG